MYREDGVEIDIPNEVVPNVYGSFRKGHMNRIRLQENLEIILSEFDFEKVHRVMEILKWSWSSTKGTPTIAEMKEAIRLELFPYMRKARMHDSIRSGGFELTYLGENRLRLVFAVAWDQTEPTGENQ